MRKFNYLNAGTIWPEGPGANGYSDDFPVVVDAVPPTLLPAQR